MLVYLQRFKLPKEMFSPTHAIKSTGGDTPGRAALFCAIAAREVPSIGHFFQAVVVYADRSDQRRLPALVYSARQLGGGSLS